MIRVKTSEAGTTWVDNMERLAVQAKKAKAKPVKSVKRDKRISVLVRLTTGKVYKHEHEEGNE